MNEEHRINIMEDAPQAEQQPQQEGPVLAGVMERFVALMIDGGLILFLYQMFLILLFRWIQPDLEQIYWCLAGIVPVFVLYETLFTCGGRSSLGKKLVGIVVVDQYTAEPLGFVRAFIRSVGYVFSTLLLMCGFLLAFIDDKHRALQDYLAGSIVLQAREKSFAERAALTLTGAVLLTLFSSMFYSQIFGAGSFAQKRLIIKAQDHLEKIAYLEEIHRINYGYYTNDLLRLSILSGDPVQFQRDTHKVLENKGFRIGVTENDFKITARAKDAKKTLVTYPEF
ncbi:MAG: RDD family protein [Elusimicrobiaceae bacterium]|nr:RDD family protein [Elusimicrobiaceae bacterium]